MYFLCEHLVLVIIAFAIAKCYEKVYRVSGWLFFIVQVVDTVDYCLTYADPWLGMSPVTFNTIKIITFGVSIAYDKRGTIKALCGNLLNK